MQNYKKAVEWFEISAQNGCKDAQFNLGMCYHLGYGVPKNDDIALRWFREAYEKGHIEAGFYLDTLSGVNNDKSINANKSNEVQKMILKIEDSYVNLLSEYGLKPGNTYPCKVPEYNGEYVIPVPEDEANCEISIIKKEDGTIAFDFHGSMKNYNELDESAYSVCISRIDENSSSKKYGQYKGTSLLVEVYFDMNAYDEKCGFNPDDFYPDII